MATEIKYLFYQVASENTITSGYPVGSLVFNKTRKELTVLSGTETAVEATVYAGGLASASFKDEKLTITDFNGDSFEVSLADFTTNEEVLSKLANYYTKLEVNNLFANVYSKTEADTKFIDSTELGQHMGQYAYSKGESYNKTETDTKISDAVSALGTVFRIKEGIEYYDNLPMENNENGDVRQVTHGDITEDSISPVAGIEFADNTEFFWNGSKWEILGVNEVDMSAYITTENANASFATKGELSTLQGNVTTLGQQLQNKVSTSTYNAKMDEIDAALCWAELN